MIPEFWIDKYDIGAAKKDYEKLNKDPLVDKFFKNVLEMLDEKTVFLSKGRIAGVGDIDALIDADDAEISEQFKTWWKENKEKYKREKPIVRKTWYNHSKSPAEQSRAARNNMIIDIIHKILTNQATTGLFFNPGNFDELKLNAKVNQIITNEDLIKEFIEENEIEDNKVVDWFLDINNKKQELIDDFLKKHKSYRDPLSIDTFIHFHHQNTVGKQLISIHALNVSMHAKYQHSKISINEKFSINFNGNEITSLHEIYSQNGKEISLNCAQFLAAAADNVKDPVLAKLMQNTKNSNITCLMLRMGFSIQDISLLFSQPIIKECIEQDGDLHNLDKFLREYENITPEREDWYKKAKETKYLYSTRELLESIINNSKYNTHDNNVFKHCVLMMNLQQIADNLANINTLSRADSSHGSAHGNLYKTQGRIIRDSIIYQKIAEGENKLVDGFELYLPFEILKTKKTLDKNYMRKLIGNDPMSRLNAFYTLGILGTKIVHKYFPEVNNSLINDTLESIIADSSEYTFRSTAEIEKLADMFYKDLIKYKLSSTSLFGDEKDGLTYREKKNYYLRGFPQKFLNIVKNNKKIAEMDLIKRLSVNDDGVLVCEGSSYMSKETVNTLMRDMDSLLYMEDGKDLAIDLFMYSYYKDGLNFGPTSLNRFFSTFFLSNFNEYIDSLNNDDFAGYINFAHQFYANHPEIAKTLNVKYEKESFIDNITKEVFDGIILIDGIPKDKQILIKYKTCKNTNIGGVHAYMYIDGVLYESEINNGIGIKLEPDDPIRYIAVETFKDKEYDANRDVNTIYIEQEEDEIIYNNTEGDKNNDEKNIEDNDNQSNQGTGNDPIALAMTAAEANALLGEKPKTTSSNTGTGNDPIALAMTAAEANALVIEEEEPKTTSSNTGTGNDPIALAMYAKDANALLGGKESSKTTPKVNPNTIMPNSEKQVINEEQAAKNYLEQVPKSTKLTPSDLTDDKKLIEISKLKNKEEIVNVNFGEKGRLLINAKTQKYKGLLYQITYDIENGFVVTMINDFEDEFTTIDDIESYKKFIDTTLSKEDAQKVINHFIPEEMQNYLQSESFKFDVMKFEFSIHVFEQNDPESNWYEYVRKLMKDELDVFAKLRDEFGIPYIDIVTMATNAFYSDSKLNQLQNSQQEKTNTKDNNIIKRTEKSISDTKVKENPDYLYLIVHDGVDMKSYKKRLFDGLDNYVGLILTKNTDSGLGGKWGSSEEDIKQFKSQIQKSFKQLVQKYAKSDYKNIVIPVNIMIGSLQKTGSSDAVIKILKDYLTQLKYVIDDISEIKEKSKNISIDINTPEGKAIFDELKKNYTGEDDFNFC